MKAPVISGLQGELNKTVGRAFHGTALRSVITMEEEGVGDDFKGDGVAAAIFKTIDVVHQHMGLQRFKSAVNVSSATVSLILTRTVHRQGNSAGWCF